MVDNASGWSAFSADLHVMAGTVNHLELEIAVAAGNLAIQAGQTFDVTLKMYDAFDNALGDDALALLASSIQWFGIDEKPECVVQPPSGATLNALEFECFFEVARDDQALTVKLDDLEQVSTEFDIVPGDLASISVGIITDTSNFVAGSELDVEFVVTDAFGNTLDTVVGGFEAFTSPASQTLTNLEVDEDGVCTAGFQLSAAGPTVVVATYDGDEVGRSSTFEVLAGPAEALTVEAERPWGWVDEPLLVTISTRDEYGNVAISNDNVTVFYANDSKQINTSLVDGVTEETLVWDEWIASDVVSAETASGLDDS